MESVATETMCSSRPPEGAALFRLEGRYWALEFHGRRTCLPDSKGLRLLAVLLKNPGRKYYARQLLQLVEAPQDLPLRTLDRRQLRVISREASLGPQLDDCATRQYRARIQSLREQLQDADECNDLCRAELLRDEIERLTAALAAAFGFRGRDRPVGDCDERARQKVRKNIKASFDAVRQTHAALGRYLTSNVKTGRYCWYDPDPDHPIRWTF